MLVATYSIYLSISLLITVLVGTSLNKNGRVFLVENFRGSEALADSINHLLLVGFYLVNAGFITLALKYGDKPTTIESIIEFLSTKIGLVILVLGTMHFFNIRGLIKFRDSGFFKALSGIDSRQVQG